MAAVGGELETRRAVRWSDRLTHVASSQCLRHQLLLDPRRKAQNLRTIGRTLRHHQAIAEAIGMGLRQHDFQLTGAQRGPPVLETSSFLRSLV
jgi:hypothetical protein